MSMHVYRSRTSYDRSRCFNWLSSWWISSRWVRCWRVRSWWVRSWRIRSWRICGWRNRSRRIRLRWVCRWRSRRWRSITSRVYIVITGTGGTTLWWVFTALYNTQLEFDFMTHLYESHYTYRTVRIVCGIVLWSAWIGLALGKVSVLSSFSIFSLIYNSTFLSTLKYPD